MIPLIQTQGYSTRAIMTASLLVMGLLRHFVPRNDVVYLVIINVDYYAGNDVLYSIGVWSIYPQNIQVIHKNMEKVEKRVNRIIGQLRGIEKMTHQKRTVEEILQQISAVKKAIDGLTKELVISDIQSYVPVDKLKEVEKMVERAINL